MLRALRLLRLDLLSGRSGWVVPVLALLPAMWLLWREEFSPLSAVLAATPLLVFAFTDTRFAIYATFLFLFLLGDIRRIVGLYIGFPTQDPLLLVGPAVTLLLSLPILYRLRLTDPISKAVFAVTVLMTLEIFNPRQGSLTVGLTGAFFQLIPLLWFWIGRRYGTDQVIFTLLFRLVLPLAVLATALGFWQIYIGFLPWQAEWVKMASAHYHSLSIAGFTRAFGFSVNGIEYVNLLLIGSTSVLGAFFAGRRVYVLLFPFLGAGLFLASSRQPILKLLIAVALAWSLRGKSRTWAARLPIAIGIGVGLLALVLTRAGGGSEDSGQPKATSAAQASTQHQVQGLAHPLGKGSTAQGHIHYFLGGIRQGFVYPIGSGLGVVRGGVADKEDTGAAELNTTEYDISDSFITMGAVGGLLYVAIVFLVIRKAISFNRSAPAYVALPVVGIVVAMIGSWTALGQYGVAPFMWFIIGSMTRPRTQSVQVRAFRPAPSVRQMPPYFHDAQPKEA